MKYGIKIINDINKTIFFIIIPLLYYYLFIIIYYKFLNFCQNKIDKFFVYINFEYKKKS